MIQISPNSIQIKCYFRDHMSERDLLFQDAVDAQLKSVGQTFLSAPSSEKDRQECLSHLYENLQATDLPQKLQAIPQKSPDLLGVILKEGKV